jgi:hypothetical protein
VPPLKAGLFLTALVLAAGTGSASAATNYRAQVEISGQVVVSFHGDPAAGCAAAFRCDVESGSIRWTPNTQGQLYLFQGRRGGRLFSALNVFSFGGGGSIGTLAILERRAADGTEHQCIDARGSSYETLPVDIVGRRTLRFGLRSSARSYPPSPPLPTRCGGPLPADWLAGLPTRDVGLRALLRGPAKIDLSGSSDFAAAGLAGTAVSTIEISVGEMRARRARVRRPRPQRPDRRRPPVRTVQVEYRVAEVSGSAPVEVQSDPRTCAPLDACGLTGSVTVTPGPAEGEAYLYAFGRMPKADLRRALGLAPGPRPRGVRIYGYLELEKGAGSVVAALERDGAPACRDTAPFRRHTLGLQVRDGRVTATFGAGEQFGFDLLGTRCPGPLSSELGRRGNLATGSVPLSAFSRERLTLALDQGTSRTTTGFQVRSRPDLKIELERERD